MSVQGFKCDLCRQTDDRAGAETFCEDCMKSKHEDLVRVADKLKETEKERDEYWERICELEEQLELEATVYAAQIREKDVLINALLEKVHAA